MERSQSGIDRRGSLQVGDLHNAVFVGEGTVNGLNRQVEVLLLDTDNDVDLVEMCIRDSMSAATGGSAQAAQGGMGGGQGGMQGGGAPSADGATGNGNGASDGGTPSGQEPTGTSDASGSVDGSTDGSSTDAPGDAPADTSADADTSQPSLSA